MFSSPDREPHAAKSLGRPAQAFNQIGSRLVFALLCRAGNKSYREMAKEAGISLGAVNLYKCVSLRMNAQDLKAAAWLRGEGHEVFSVFDEARGVEDDKVIQKAYDENWSP